MGENIEVFFSLKVFKIYFRKKAIKEITKNHKEERHKRKTSTNVHLHNDCCFGGRSKEWRKNQKVAEDGGNGGAAEAHFARTTLGASLDPKLLSLRILHL